jgi:hypothetical protein
MANLKAVSLKIKPLLYDVFCHTSVGEGLIEMLQCFTFYAGGTYTLVEWLTAKQQLL